MLRRPQSNKYTKEPAVFVATIFILRDVKQLLVKYSFVNESHEIQWIGILWLIDRCRASVSQA